VSRQIAELREDWSDNKPGMTMVAASGAVEDARAYAKPLAIAAAGLLLSWPAFHNGFPLVTVDTAAYLEALGPGTAKDSAVFYGAFLRTFGSQSLWPVVLLQGLIVAHLLHLTLKASCGALRAEAYLWIVAWLAAFSSLPWFVSLILPDVMVGVMVLGLFLLGAAPDRLTPAERWYVVALTTLAVAADAVHIVLGIGLIGLLMIMGRILQRPRRRPIPAVVLLIAPVAVAALGHVAVNAASGRGPVIAPTAPISMLAGMIRSGTAQAYLAEHCADRRFQLCERLAELRREPENFSDDLSRLASRGDDSARWREEARTIVKGVLHAYPTWQAGKVAENTLRQLFVFGGEDWLILRRPAEQWVGRSIRDRFPAEYALYLGARQSTGRLSPDAIGIWHGFAAITGVTLSAFLFLEFARRSDRVMIFFFAAIAMALITNALLTGGLTQVEGRNQARIVWLAILYAALATHYFRLCSAADTAREDLVSPR
jgi:hypothetical protein